MDFLKVLVKINSCEGFIVSLILLYSVAAFEQVSSW